MLVAADVGVHGQPVRWDALVEGAVREVGGRIAEEVPARVQEGVGDVGFSSRRFAALRAVRSVPLPDAVPAG